MLPRGRPSSPPVKTRAPPVNWRGRGGRIRAGMVSGVIAVDLAFATGQVDPPDRLAAWRELVNRVFLPLSITPIGIPRGGFEGSVTGRSLGGIRVWLVRASPMSAVRARRHIRASGPDDYLLALHVTGTAHGAQDGREVTLGPGDLALFDSSRPYSISFTGPGVFEHVIYQVPRASLDARGRLSATTALRVSAASSAGQLASPYLRTLARLAPSGPGPAPGWPFIDAGLDLAVGALRTVAGYADQADPRRLGLASALRDHALARLGDPGLSPQAVAGAGYVSVRQLHRLFASEGLSFARWVREQRLRRCRDDLADLRLGHLTIAEIAGRWGFRSAAHFTRAFRARYGITPADHRRACRNEH
jgi:AraC-like DNA-binding protein